MHLNADPAPTPGTTLDVEGMTCGNCARRVGDALRSVAGVAQVQVALEQGQATVQWDPSAPIAPAALISVLRQAGYPARLAPDSPGNTASAHQSWSPFRGWKFNVVLGSLVTLPLLVAEWILQLGMTRGYHWFAFLLVLPLQIFGGARFYRGAWNQLKIGRSNMDTLVALGSTSAFGYSVWALFAGIPGHLYFMESAAIITLISVGHAIEAKVSARAASSLHALLKLAPSTARRRNPDGSETEVPVATLQLQELIILKPGDRVPTDAEVVEGASALDESMLTGESLPVEKTPGASLYAGTVNQNGRLLARVAAVGQATALAHIIAIVERAQSSRADIQRLGDRVSSVFVPVVILIALATGLWWGLAPDSARAAAAFLEPFLWTAHHGHSPLASAIYHVAAVLIIACPCAMGLATPVAIMAGANAAAQRGILIRDGIALEKSGTITAIAFDKTGTLTQAKVRVAELLDLRPDSAKTVPVEAFIASLARPSNHPLSRAAALLSSSELPVHDWQEHRGSGVQARLEAYDSSTVWRLGSVQWLRSTGVPLQPATAFIKRWSEQGASLLGLASGPQLAAVIALRDELRPGAPEVVATLRNQGLNVYLITGDNRATAQAIARQTGIDPGAVFAEVRPERKAAIIAELQKHGNRIAFVGDGINDAPALEQSDLGIAVTQASDVAREAADMILLKSDIHGIPEALDLARATLRVIKQNLFWAFFYNAAAIPLAVLGFLSPVVSALAMGLSDLIVIGNALRLRRRGK